MADESKLSTNIKRLDYIEVAKGLAIIAIVVGHTGSPFKNFLYLFNLPVFYFISGFLFSDRYIDNPLTFVIKRIKSLYIPFVGYELFFLVFHNFFINVGIYSGLKGFNFSPVSRYTLQNIASRIINILTFGGTEQLLTPFWFLTSLFSESVFHIY